MIFKYKMQTLTTKFGRNLQVLDGFSFVNDKDGPFGKTRLEMH